MIALTEGNSHLSEIVDEVSLTGSAVEISRNGRTAAVVISYEEYESLLETLNILSDEATMNAIIEAESEIASGDIIELD